MAKEGKPELLKPKAARRKLKPLAGFWLRTGAMVLDLIFLRFFLYGLVFLSKEHLFAMGINTVYVGMVIIIGYFVLLEGPIGKGKTIGKALLNIGLYDYEVNPLMGTTALVRSLICLNVVIISGLMSAFFDIVTSPAQMFFLNLLSGFIWGFLIANAILIGVHPLKQGFHDLYAKSLVTKENMRTSYNALREQLPDFNRLQGSAFQSAAIAFVVMIVLAGFMNFRYSFSEEEKERIQQMNEIREQYTIEGFDLMMYQAGYAPERFRRDSVPVGETQVEEEPTTPPAGADSERDVKYCAVFYYRSYRSFDKEAAKNDPEVRRMLYSLGRWAKENIPEQAFPGKEESESGEEANDKRKVERIYLVLEQRINLTLLYQYSEDVTLKLDI